MWGKCAYAVDIGRGVSVLMLKHRNKVTT